MLINILKKYNHLLDTDIYEPYKNIDPDTVNEMTPFIMQIIRELKQTNSLLKNINNSRNCKENT